MYRQLDKLEQACQQWGIDLSKYQWNKFALYMRKIKEWNEKFNITANDQEEDIVVKHFIDSLSGYKYILNEANTIMDIGTGAGFPGLPLKIIRPDLHITFIDSSKKKMSALYDICQALNIDHYLILDKNIELIGRDTAYRETYDVVVVRALAPLNCLLEYGLPILRKNGHMIIYKGPGVEPEVENSQAALQLLGGKLLEKDHFYLPFSDRERVILNVEKMGKTLDKYPRAVGIPRKRPLK